MIQEMWTIRLLVPLPFLNPDKICSLSHSIIFLYFFALIMEEGFLISSCYLELCIQWVYLSFSPLSFISLLFSAICKASSDSHFAFFHCFSWGWSWPLSPIQCREPLSIVIQALSLSDLIPWIYFSLLLYNCKGFDLGHTWWSQWFSLLFQFKSEFCNKEVMIRATVSF